MLISLPLLLALLVQVQSTPPEATGSGDYQIGPGDILKVTVFGSEDLSPTVVVQPDGTVTFPLLGAVAVDGRSPADLATHLRDRLASGFVRAPQVTVTVLEYRSKRVYVMGAVARPGAYALTGSTSILELLARAGLSSTEGGTAVTVVRPSPDTSGPVLPGEAGSAQVIHVGLGDLQSGNLAKNFDLRPSDTLFVAPAARVYVSGEVRNPGSFPYTPGLTARQAIALAGGLTEDGTFKGIRLVREANGKLEQLKVKVEEQVLPGDIVEVRAKLF